MFLCSPFKGSLSYNVQVLIAYPEPKHKPRLEEENTVNSHRCRSMFLRMDLKLRTLSMKAWVWYVLKASVFKDPQDLRVRLQILTPGWDRKDGHEASQGYQRHSLRT